MADTENVKFYNAQDGVRGRDGGPYADAEDARIREEQRARAEDREPNFEQLQPFVGNMVVTGRTVVDNLNSNPSMAAAPGPVEQNDENVNTDEDHYRVTVGELPVDRTDILDDEDEDEDDDDEPVAKKTTTKKSASSKKAAAKRTSSKK